MVVDDPISDFLKMHNWSLKKALEVSPVGYISAYRDRALWYRINKRSGHNDMWWHTYPTTTRWPPKKYWR